MCGAVMTICGSGIEASDGAPTSPALVDAPVLLTAVPPRIEKLAALPRLTTPRPAVKVVALFDATDANDAPTELFALTVNV